MTPSPNIEVPEEAVKALMLGRIAEQHGNRYSDVGGWDEFHKDRPADARLIRELALGDARAAAPAIREQVEAEYPKAGEMHSVDKAFYNTAIKERDHAWAESERHARERDQAAKQERHKVREALEYRIAQLEFEARTETADLYKLNAAKAEGLAEFHSILEE